MKKFLLIPILALAFPLFSNAQIVSTKNILSNIQLAVETIEAAGAQIEHILVDYVMKNGNSTNTYYLQANSAYKIVAIGDSDRIGDIDLSVYDDNDTEVGKDADDKNVAVVDVRPKWAANYKFTVTPYKMDESVTDGFYGIIVVRVE